MSLYIVAVDLGGTQIRAALCDPRGQILRRIAKPTLAHKGKDVVLERIADTIAAAIEDIEPGDVAAIGVGAPGPLDPITGIIREAPNLPGWYNVPLRTLISARFGRPTYLGNDANLAALAEFTYGAGRDVRDMIYLTISTGIGGGIIVDGKMLLGANGLAAEVGHMVITADRALAEQDVLKDLESLASGPAIARYVVQQIRAGTISKVSDLVGGDLSQVTARVVNEAAQAGDDLSIQAFWRAGKYLGVGIVNLLHLFNPRMIVLGGSVTKAGSLLFDPVREAITALAKKPYTEGLAIVPAALGDNVGLFGAVALAVTESGLLRQLT